MHRTAITFAIRHNFRLKWTNGNYYLCDQAGGHVDVANAPYGRHTAASALRMMRRHLRRGLIEGRAVRPI